jgi:hypothetical protein
MKLVRQAMLLICAAAWIGLVSASGGCGSNNGDNPDGGLGLGDAAGGSFFPDSGNSFNTGDGGVSAPCPGTGGLDCYVDPNCSTTLSGTVYDPAGRNPLYNVVVFIPNDPLGTLPAIEPGTHSCNTCDVSIGNYISATVTDSKGHFTLTGVPATSHVPLVVQTGKWRREVFLSSVTSCTDNKVDATNSRLPKNHKEGDLPQMALLTGGCDDLGCFMKSMGVDDAEFTAPHGGGRLDVYQGLGLGGGGFGGNTGATLSTGRAGNCTNASCPLWASKQSFEYYDIAILSCECGENRTSKPQSAIDALHGWLNEGGKVFASHYHYTWFQYGPPEVAKLGNWLGSTSATGMGTYSLDTSFPKGVVFHDWLQNVNALSGQSSIQLTSVASSLGAINSPATRWIYGPAGSVDTKYMSFLTPVGGIPGSGNTGTPEAGTPTPMPEASTPEASAEASAPADAETDALADAAEEAEASTRDAGKASDAGPPETNSPQYCGKAVFTDLHTSSGLMASARTIPADCSGAPLTAQQKALEFLFFDLSACVSTDTTPPPPPPPPTR